MAITRPIGIGRRLFYYKENPARENRADTVFPDWKYCIREVDKGMKGRIKSRVSPKIYFFDVFPLFILLIPFSLFQ